MNYKEQLLATGKFKKATDGWYRTNCPFCMYDKGQHLYMKIDVTDDSNVGYNCFKCNAHGSLSYKLLELLNITDIKLPKFKGGRRIERSKVSETYNVSTVEESDGIDKIREYINSRVGHYPTIEELRMFQYMGNPEKYVDEYLKGDKLCLKNRYWFRISNGNIVGRYHNDDTHNRWLKYRPGCKVESWGIYNIKMPFDIYQPINVVIAEGIMDVIGLYYNNPISNAIYIAVLGKNYGLGMRYIINRGIFGRSVNVKIFKDSDVDNIRMEETDICLFKNVQVYENMSAKDYGVLPDKLDIFKTRTIKTD